MYSVKVCNVWLSATTWTVTHQAPLSMGFSRQEYWSGLAIPFSRGSSWPRNRTQVSCTAGRFFTVWATREAPVNSVARAKSWGYKAKSTFLKCRAVPSRLVSAFLFKLTPHCSLPCPLRSSNLELLIALQTSSTLPHFHTCLPLPWLSLEGALSSNLMLAKLLLFLRPRLHMASSPDAAQPPLSSAQALTVPFFIHQDFCAHCLYRTALQSWWTCFFLSRVWGQGLILSYHSLTQFLAHSRHIRSVDWTTCIASFIAILYLGQWGLLWHQKLTLITSFSSLWRAIFVLLSTSGQKYLEPEYKVEELCVTGTNHPWSSDKEKWYTFFPIFKFPALQVNLILLLGGDLSFHLFFCSCQPPT